MPKNRVALSLFWRTFFLLAMLLAGGVFAWTQTFRALEFEPRAAQAAQQIASLVNLARAVLTSVDGINRVALVKSMSDPGSIKLTPREPGDRWTSYEVDRFTRATGAGAARPPGPGHAGGQFGQRHARPVGRLHARQGSATGCWPTRPGCRRWRPAPG